MKHSKKMALVPYDQAMSTLSHTSNKSQSSTLNTEEQHEKEPYVPRDIVKDKLSSLDKEMTSILQNSSLTPNEKVMQYNAALDDYLVFNEKYHNHREKKNLPGIINSTDAEQDVIKDSLISTLPQSYQKNGELILEFLKRDGTEWNTQGVLFDRGKKIPDTNIVDLVHYVLRRKRKKVAPPTGLAEFRELLRKANLPKHLLHLSKDPASDTDTLPEKEPYSSVGHGAPKIRKWERY